MVLEDWPRSAWSRHFAGTDAAGTPVQRSQPARPSRQTRDKDAVVLRCRDHVVRDTGALLLPAVEGLAVAVAGRIWTFGVRPERRREYGYINPATLSQEKVRAVAKFVESPIGDGGRYMKAGYLWNSGNFHVPRLGAARDIGRSIAAKRCRPSAIP